MPTKHTHVEPTLILEHNGVSIYQAYTEDDADCPCDLTFTANPKATDSMDPQAFYVPDLDVPSAHTWKAEYPRILVAPSSPEYITECTRVQNWFLKRSPLLIENAIREGIEAGIIKG